MLTIKSRVGSYYSPGTMKIVKFPAGETLLQISSLITNARNMISTIEEVEVEIELLFESNDDLINLALLVDAVNEWFKLENYKPRIVLNIPYFPYARQDRVCNPGESHSMRVIAKIINSLNFSKVKVFDPHSDVVEALINNVVIETPLEALTDILYNQPVGTVILVSPDAGAHKKVQKLAKSFGLGIIHSDKERDVATGAITGARVDSPHVGDKNLMIVDDICDGGMTFLNLVPELRKITSGKVFLFVSHGIFSKGLDALGGAFDVIYTRNNMSGLSHPKLKVINA